MNTMTPEAQRIAIATACGIPAEVPHWRYSFRAHGEEYNVETHERFRMQDACEVFGCSAEEFKALNPDIPDYPNDLNAMHDAEKVLTDKQAYRHVLCRVCADKSSPFVASLGDVVHATAAQRAQAFLRTLNLWEDGK